MSQKSTTFISRRLVNQPIAALEWPVNSSLKWSKCLTPEYMVFTVARQYLASAGENRNVCSVLVCTARKSKTWAQEELPRLLLLSRWRGRLLKSVHLSRLMSFMPPLQPARQLKELFRMITVSARTSFRKSSTNHPGPNRVSQYAFGVLPPESGRIGSFCAQ